MQLSTKTVVFLVLACIACASAQTYIAQLAHALDATCANTASGGSYTINTCAPMSTYFETKTCNGTGVSLWNCSTSACVNCSLLSFTPSCIPYPGAEGVYLQSFCVTGVPTVTLAPGNFILDTYVDAQCATLANLAYGPLSYCANGLPSPTQSTLAICVAGGTNVTVYAGAAGSGSCVQSAQTSSSVVPAATCVTAGTSSLKAQCMNAVLTTSTSSTSTHSTSTSTSSTGAATTGNTTSTTTTSTTAAAASSTTSGASALVASVALLVVAAAVAAF